MNQKTSKLLRKYINIVGQADQKTINQTLRTAKKSYLLTPKNKRFMIKSEMRCELNDLKES